MFHFFVNLLNFSTRCYPVEIIWTAGENKKYLLHVLKKFKDSYLANQSEDFNGERMVIGAKGIIFKTSQDRNSFLSLYGKKFKARKVNYPMSLTIEKF